MMMMRELQIHYTYRGPELEYRRGLGLGSGTGKHLEGQTTFGIQCMHALNAHEKPGQMGGGKNLSD